MNADWRKKKVKPGHSGTVRLIPICSQAGGQFLMASLDHAPCCCDFSWAGSWGELLQANCACAFHVRPVLAGDWKCNACAANAGVCQRPCCDLIGCPVFWRRRETSRPLKHTGIWKIVIRCSLLAVDGMETCCWTRAVADGDRERKTLAVLCRTVSF